MIDLYEIYPGIFHQKNRGDILADLRKQPELQKIGPNLLQCFADVQLAVSLHDLQTGAGLYWDRCYIRDAKLALADFVLEEFNLLTEPMELQERDEIRATKFGNKGFVYLMRNSRNGYTKIGFSKHPRFREKTLQSEEPEIEIVAMIPGTTDLEAAIHHKYSPARIRGEWFLLSAFDIDDIVVAFS